MKILVLGAGRVGAAVAQDLARDADFAITVADREPAALEPFAREPLVSTEIADLMELGEIQHLAEGKDVVVVALPPAMGDDARLAAIEAGVHVVDASLCDRDPFAQHEAAVRQGVTVLVDCALTPGLSNLLAGILSRRLDLVESLRCDAGSLPAERKRPFEFATVRPASAELRELSRPARWVVEGHLQSLPPLSGVEPVEVPGIGTLEAIPSDGLRTLLESAEVPNLAFRTLRYPGHAERLRFLLAAGLLEAAPREVAGTFVSPLVVTASLLESRWALADGASDLTVLTVEADGSEDGREVTARYRLLDRSDPAGGPPSAIRTSAYTCASIARIVARGLFERPGVAGLEEIGADAVCSEYVLRDLTERGIVARRESETETDPEATQNAMPSGRQDPSR